jgi:sulfate adenylyltransferase subunit 2
MMAERIGVGRQTYRRVERGDPSVATGTYLTETHPEPFTGVIVGVRADEEGSRSKERYFSPRDKSHDWNVDDQPPELWRQYTTDFAPGTHIRIHPLLHWTEVNIWEYVDRERIPLVDLYYARDGQRNRSLGCAPCTFAIQSNCTNVPDIIAELKATKVPERATRAQDQESEGAFEQLRATGYM